MTREQYHIYCQSTPDLPLFLQDWWMDAVCTGKTWHPVAGMPCLVRRRFGMKYVLMPQQTQIAGALEGDAQTIADALRDEHLAYYYQHFPLGSPLPEQLARLGFNIRRHTTYRIEDLSDLDALQKRFSENKRRQIRKAADLHLTSLTPERFYAFHRECLQAQHKQISYSEAFFTTLARACEQHQAGQILALQDEAGQLHAAVFLVFDPHTCYFLIPCYAPAHNRSGAGARIVLEALRFAAEHSQTFDFEGSMIPSVANHYAQFASKPAYFYEVEKVYNPLFPLILKAYRFLTRKQR